MNSWQFLDKLERKWSGLREGWSLLLIHPSIQHTHQNHPLYTLLKSLLIYLSRKKVKKKYPTSGWISRFHSLLQWEPWYYRRGRVQWNHVLRVRRRNERSERSENHYCCFYWMVDCKKKYWRRLTGNSHLYWTHIKQCYPQRMILQGRLYRIYSFCIFKLDFYCSCKLQLNPKY